MKEPSTLLSHVLGRFAVVAVHDVIQLPLNPQAKIKLHLVHLAGIAIRVLLMCQTSTHKTEELDSHQLPFLYSVDLNCGQNRTGHYL